MATTATWPCVAGEISPEHFDDIRWLCWAVRNKPLAYTTTEAEWLATLSDYDQNYEQTWQNPENPEDYRKYGYYIGQIVKYDSDIYLCIESFPAVNNVVTNIAPPSSHWLPWASIYHYSHWHHNSGRVFTYSVPSSPFDWADFWYKPAWHFLPRQVIATTQVNGLGYWQPNTIYYPGECHSKGGTYKRCKLQHVSDLTNRNWDNGTYWEVITLPLKTYANPKPQPVAFNEGLFDGDEEFSGTALGPVYPAPFYGPGMTADPMYYGYFMNNNTWASNLPRSVEDNDHVNVKMMRSYQQHVEILPNHSYIREGKQIGGSSEQGIYSPGDYSHQLGRGRDPSSDDYQYHNTNSQAYPFQKGNFGFNHSAFEECLYLTGHYDWVLCVNPQIDGVSMYPETDWNYQGYHTLYCWRRTWRCTAGLPANAYAPTPELEFVTRLRELHAALAAGGKPRLWIEETDSQSANFGGWETHKMAYHAGEDGFTGYWLVFPTVVNWGLLYGSGYDYLKEVDAAEAYALALATGEFIVLASEAAAISYCAGTYKSANSVDGTDTPVLTAYDYIWPGTKGNPPEPLDEDRYYEIPAWCDAQACAALIGRIPGLLTTEEKAQMTLRHSCRDPLITGEPELAAMVLNDMYDVFQFLKYQAVSIGLEDWYSSKGFAGTFEDPLPLCNSLAEAAGVLNSGIAAAEWSDWDWQPVQYGVYGTAGTEMDGSTPKYRPSGASAVRVRFYHYAQNSESPLIGKKVSTLVVVWGHYHGIPGYYASLNSWHPNSTAFGDAGVLSGNSDCPDVYDVSGNLIPPLFVWIESTVVDPAVPIEEITDWVLFEPTYNIAFHEYIVGENIYSLTFEGDAKLNLVISGATSCIVVDPFTATRD